jgi:hypothetical protein
MTEVVTPTSPIGSGIRVAVTTIVIFGSLFAVAGACSDFADEPLAASGLEELAGALVAGVATASGEAALVVDAAGVEGLAGGGPAKTGDSHDPTIKTERTRKKRYARSITTLVARPSFNRWAGGCQTSNKKTRSLYTKDWASGAYSPKATLPTKGRPQSHPTGLLAWVSSSGPPSRGSRGGILGLRPPIQLRGSAGFTPASRTSDASR